MRKDPAELDGYIVDQEYVDAIKDFVARYQAAMPSGMGIEQFENELSRRVRGGDFIGAWRLWRSCDRQAIRAAILDLDKVIGREQWYVSGVRVPPDVQGAAESAPKRSRKSLMAGVEAAIRGLAGVHPRLGQILENAAARREEGQVFAEASRERRDELYRERVTWVAGKYREVRRKYQDGPSGDSAARMEVAVLYSRLTGKEPMHDKSVRNLLEAAAKIEAEAHAETAE